LYGLLLIQKFLIDDQIYLGRDPYQIPLLIYLMEELFQKMTKYLNLN